MNTASQKTKTKKCLFFQIWDLRAGKLMTEFNNHGGPVHDVEFHPHEFLLASGKKKAGVF